MYVVTVEFTIGAASARPFLVEMLANARASLTERGCIQFDVCADPVDHRRVFLYEVYIDRAAFDAHLSTEHFKMFDRTVAPWIESKVVKTWDLQALAPDFELPRPAWRNSQKKSAAKCGAGCAYSRMSSLLEQARRTVLRDT